jgi:SAM-dependent methyltransferase
MICGEGAVLEKAWFASSITLSKNDFERRLLAMPPSSFDLISCVNVLQDVTDMEVVLRILGQSLSPTGTIFLMYQNPVLRAKTEDWGSPQPNRGGSRRAIGRDFEARYAKIFPELLAFHVSTTDPVTRDEDIAYLITKNPIWLEQAFNLSFDVRLLD